MALAFFVAALRCVECGQVSAADSSTDMIARMVWEPRIDFLRVGDHLDIDLADLTDHYFTLRLPEATEEIHLLERWLCHHCQAMRWAEIVLAGGEIVSITAVALTPTVLDRIHFISERASDWYRDLTGDSLYAAQKEGADLAALIRAQIR